MNEDQNEYIRLWNEWLKTKDGQGYVASSGDYLNQLCAMRGRCWVYEKIIARLKAERDAGVLAEQRQDEERS